MGDWLEVNADLVNQAVSFTVWPHDNSAPSFATWMQVEIVCVCVTLCSKEFRFGSYRRGPGRMHRRLVNEAGDASEDMEMGRHFHVPAKNCCSRCDSTFPFLFPWWFFA